MGVVIIADKPGQLGNMLFLFAHFIGRAIESNFTVINPAFENYARYFPMIKDDLFCRFPPHTSFVGRHTGLRKTVYRGSNFAVRALWRLGGNFGLIRSLTIPDWTTTLSLDGEEFLSLVQRRRLIFVRGWLFRDQKMLEKHADTIRKFFRPLPEHEKNVDELISRARQDSDVLVGVHMRHGIIDFDNARHYWHGPEQYAQMMEKVQALFPGKRVTFLICSDKEQSPEPFTKFRYLFGNYDLIEDMYSFARCDYIFGSPSTYTLWASFYGKVPICLVMNSDREFALDDFVMMPAC